MRKTLRILVCDDYPSNLVAFRRLLESLLPRSTIVTAEDGQIGINHIEVTDFDLILTDLEMPNADGLEVIRKAKARSGKSVIILISGTIDDNDPHDKTRNDALKAGADFALRKPFMLEVLKDCLKNRGLL